MDIKDARKWEKTHTRKTLQVPQPSLDYLILAESRLILSETQAPQPDHDVHDGRPSIMGGTHHLPGKLGCPGWRWGSQGFAKHAEV